MGADFPGDIEALNELRALSDKAKEYLCHHIRNSLTVIMLGIECGKLILALEAAEHIEDDLKKILEVVMETHNADDCENETQQNLMKIVEYLATDVFRPVTEKEICNALDIPQRKTTWALYNLASRGWTEQVAGGWRLAPRLVKVSEAVRMNFLEVVSRYLE